MGMGMGLPPGGGQQQQQGKAQAPGAANQASGGYPWNWGLSYTDVPDLFYEDRPIPEQFSVLGRDTYGTWHSHLARQMAEWMMPQIGRPSPVYPGPAWAGMSPLQGDVFNAYADVGRRGVGDLLGNVQGALTGALTGQPIPGLTERATQEYIQNVGEPVMDWFTERAYPAFGQGQAAGGTYTTGAGQLARERMNTDLFRTLSQGAGQYATAQQQGALGRQLQGVGAGQEWLGQLGRVGEQQRQLGQAPLDLLRQEWMRTRPESSPLAQLMMNLTGLGYGQPQREDGGGGLFK